VETDRRARQRTRAHLRTPQAERLEPRRLLAVVPFAAHDIDAAPIRPAGLHAVDVDNDGDFDLLAASAGDGTIAWYENTDGTGRFDSRHVITRAADGARGVYAGDLDGDGDVDAVSASYKDHRIAWYENTDGKGTFGEPRVIAEGVQGASSVLAVDVDGDGDLDVLAASFHDDTIAWFENTDGNGSFGYKHVITTAADRVLSIHAADLDGDGDIDVASASYNDNKVAWYENLDGRGQFGAQRIVTTSAHAATSVHAGDIDGDGDADLISASSFDGKIVWYENVDGKGTFKSSEVIATSAGHVWSISIGDIDRDGDLDVLSASRYDNRFVSQVVWHENWDGLGTFWFEHRVSAAVYEAWVVHAADVDGDDDLDIFSASIYDYKIAVYVNLDGAGTYGNQRTIGAAALAVESAVLADVDADGDLDAISASRGDSKIAWYENLDGLGTFGKQRIISMSGAGAWSVYAVDVDGDGDLDVLAASYRDDEVAWYENLDGKGTFGPQRLITASADGALSVYAGDLDGDGDLDVVSADFYADKVSWYENLDGKGAFSQPITITNLADGAWSVSIGDMDGDGDLDVLSASYNNATIAWYENTDGKATFGGGLVVSRTINGVTSAHAVDVDGDADLDILSTSFHDDKIVWYENTDGNGTFGSQRIIETSANGAYRVSSGDIDGDGDLDAISATEHADRIAWHENLDGAGNFADPQVISSSADGARSVSVGDIDNDGDLDVISTSINDSKIAWYENLSEAAHRKTGDVNGDGRFDSSDLVLVFQAGKYEDGVPRNAMFDQGDWNGDLDFDSGDLILAFQEGAYQSAPSSAHRVVDAAVISLYFETEETSKPRRRVSFDAQFGSRATWSVQ
jgi:hypothetical protein